MNPGHALHYFEEITKIPRPSKQEEKIRAYLLRFAGDHALAADEDGMGNICIRKPAAAGCEGMPTVVLQAHMDMVCEKDLSSPVDFTTDPIQTKMDGDWIQGCGTTLGADNGIGIALALAVLTTDINAGPVECVFTVDEETGLTGAKTLSAEFFTGALLINLDSEEEGAICTGCAGGVETVAAIPYAPVPAPADYLYYRLDIDGLTGGHSGIEIHLGRANSVKLLAEFLHRISGAVLCEISGGNLPNAIPRHAAAVFGVPDSETGEVEKTFAAFAAEAVERYQTTDPAISLSLLPASFSGKSVPRAVADGLITALHDCPSGVLAMSDVIPGLVQTSTNLSSIHMEEGDIITVTFQRSAGELEKHAASENAAKIFRRAEAKISTRSEYPGWMPDATSSLLKTAVTTYEELFGTQPQITATHAGLECGLLRTHHPNLAMISIGPNITGAHSPKERLQISSVERVWLFLQRLLENIGAKT